MAKVSVDELIYATLEALASQNLDGARARLQAACEAEPDHPRFAARWVRALLS